MKKKFAVIGLGHFGLNLSLHLMERNAEVLSVDFREERVELLRDRVSHTVVADCRDLRAMRQLGLQEMDTVVVSIGEDFESSVLATAHCQEIGVKHIVNRVVSPVHERILKLMKVTDLVLPEDDAAYQLSRRMTMTGVLESLELTNDFSIVEVKAPKYFVGKSVEQVNMRRKYNVNLVTVIRRTERTGLMTLGERDKKMEVLGVPTSDFVFSNDDILVIFGQEKHINSFSSATT